MVSRQYWIYILSSHSRTLYVGVTGNLLRRVYQHKCRLVGGFTAKYNVVNLVYFESTNDIRSAIRREKRLKAMTRKKKLRLIHAANPRWHDLAADWFDRPPATSPDPSVAPLRGAPSG
jgi:putative endonuclease